MTPNPSQPSRSLIIFGLKINKYIDITKSITIKINRLKTPLKIYGMRYKLLLT